MNKKKTPLIKQFIKPQISKVMICNRYRYSVLYAKDIFTSGKSHIFPDVYENVNSLKK
jgi:hypothetical protein